MDDLLEQTLDVTDTDLDGNNIPLVFLVGMQRTFLTA